MTLFRQLMLLIIILFVSSLSGTLYVTFQNSRVFFLEQLEVQTQDTATSLGLSLSSNAKDKAVMLSMISAIFDRGYFSRIELKSMENEVIISRNQSKPTRTVPKWFVQLVHFPSPQRSALVMSGWQQLGELTVISDPSIAYNDMWEMTYDLFIWFISLTISFLIFAYFCIKLLFSPLKKIAAQARAICKNEFYIDDKLPKTRELNIVADAMNKMVVKLKSLFIEQAELIQNLRQRVYQDPLVNIGNRRYFEQNLNHLLTSEEAYQKGALILIEINDFSAYNQKHGFAKGDELILGVFDRIQKNYPRIKGQFQARIAGATFALVVHETNQTLLMELTNNILVSIQEYMHPFGNEISCSAGIVIYQFNEQNATVLSRVDDAIGQARQKGVFKAHLLKTQDNETVFTREDWQKQISYALAHKTFVFYGQQVVNHKGDIFHQEVYSKLINENKMLLSANQFFPMAEKVLLATDIDLYVIGEMLQRDEALKETLAINISSSSVQSREVLQQLFKPLQLTTSKRKFHFEFSEHVIISCMEQSIALINKLTALGHKVGLDRVGSGLLTLQYLSQLKLHYIKIDGSYSQDIASNEEKQLFVSHLKIAARTLGIEVIATNIQSAGDWDKLRQLGIIWGQGRYLNDTHLI